jgi:hypothetical protein
MKLRILVLGLVGLLTAIGAVAQQALVIPAGDKQEVVLTAKTDSTPVQLAFEKQKNLQLQSQLLQEQFQKQLADMQKQFGVQEQLITDWIVKTKHANGFGDDVTYDREQNKWFKTAKQKSESKTVKPAEQ